MSIFDIGKMTRNPIPFKIKLHVKLINIMEQGEEFVGELSNVGYTINLERERAAKDYGYSSYPGNIYREFVEDIWQVEENSGFFIQSFNFPNTFNIRLTPINNTTHFTDMKYAIRTYFSLTHLCIILMPYFSHRWKNIHLPSTVWDAEDFSTEELMYFEESLEHISRLESISYARYATGRRAIKLNFVDSHPGMFLSGLSLIQSILSRAIERAERQVERNIHGLEGVAQDPVEQFPFVFTDTDKETHDLWWDYKERGMFDVETNSIYGFMEDSDTVTYNDRVFIPGLSQNYQNARGVLLDILREYTRNTGTIKDRVSRLIWSHFRYNETDHIPTFNHENLFKLDREDFEWNEGPEVI